MWEFKISAGNHEGPGPESPISRSLSGQDAPDVKPEGAKMQAETANTVTLEWKPVTLLRGSVDGYKVSTMSCRSMLRLLVVDQLSELTC